VIPEGRIAQGEAETEIDSIFQAVPEDRLEWRFGKPLGKDYDLGMVLSEGIDAIVLTTGLGCSAGIVDEDKRPEGVVDALAFLREVNEDRSRRITGSVAVIGGGNTAMDAATLATDRGAEQVYLLYRRSYAQMPAWPAERAQALEKGIHFLVLTQPVSYELNADGALAGVRMVRTRLGEPDASGRPRPEPIPDSDYVLQVELAIEAVGERLSPELKEALRGVELTESGLVRVEENGMTTWKGIFAAGDVVSGGSTVVQSVAEGTRVADAVDGHLRNSHQ
jgi:NADPH-dependent glutamate synthase beta subunit-like oxidoreductase